MLVEPDHSTEWPDRQKTSKDYNDPVHDNIKVHYPLNLLIDTKEFQRLRHIKQVGVCCYVYPSATNDRFGHSLGAYHLAYMFVMALIQSYGKQFEINKADILCVCVAALFHDIGHGPFSHLFEEVFEGKSHEDIGLDIVKRIFDRPNIREAFAPYLGSGEEYDKNVLFIQELIHPDRLFDEDKNWLKEGRTQDKSFLYEIVSNPLTGLDVDKYDYLLRDSFFSGCNVAFSRVDVCRIRDNFKIFRDQENPKHVRFCYNQKVAESIRNVGESRQSLHNKLYRHKTVCVINKIMVEVLTAAKHFKIRGTELKNIKDDMDIYIQLDDTIINEILRSTDESLAESRALLNNLNLRQIPKFLCSHKTSPDVVKRLTTLHCKSQKSLKNWIQSQLPEGAIVIERDINRGDRSENPVKKVYFFNSRDKLLQPFKLSEKELRLNHPFFGSYHDFCIFGKLTCSTEQMEEIKAKFSEIVQLFKSEENPVDEVK